ncbi:MAG: family 10 glycosylhydrolase [Candidatus Azobacteroides sp.]|nr:family 10 glycosylhydrolase [Candidatus Azobacteroides sp.]
MLRYLLSLFIVFTFTLACSKDNTVEEMKPEIPIDMEKPDSQSNKSIQMWIDAHANFSRFATQANITSYLEKIKETGFNEIYVDVKPGIGYALYDSDILPKLTQWDNETVNRDWDYLGYIIEEAERLKINVIASISTLGFGYTRAQQGLVYDDNRWDGKTQMAMVDQNPDNIEDIRTRSDVDAALLNPALPEVQSFVISIIEEIITKYPKLKGICLDYCRWYNNDSGRYYGFEDATLAAFEAHSGVELTSKNDIITSAGGMGPLFSRWTEFRSMTITNLITNIRSKIKAIHPEMELHLWASAHWASRYGVAQNWASKKYVPSGLPYTATYNTTGFADQLDVFSLGAYAEAVWKSENPGSDWSVENFVTTYDRYTMGDCKVVGSIGTYAYGSKAASISDAVYLCLKNTDGVMVFELSHVINNNQWAAIKDGINRGLK